MNTENLKPLLGKPINHPDVMAFLEENQYKLPKTLGVSNRKTDTGYWLENKKLKVDLYFDTVVHRQDYELIPAEKKGVFIPILTHIRIYGNEIETPFSLPIKKKISFQKMIDTLGNFTSKSSDRAKVWLNDDSTESWYEWEFIEEDKNAIFSFSLDMPDEMIYEFWLNYLTDWELFTLYFVRQNETFEGFSKKLSPYRISYLLFLRWAIENDWVQERGKTSAVREQIKNGEASVLDFIKALGRGYIAQQDFVKEKQDLVEKYIRNQDVEIYLYKEVCSQVLTPAELDDYFSAEVEEILAQKLNLSEEFYQKMKAIWDKKEWGK